MSDAEQRRILRERRAAKMKQASARLGKITGERPGFEEEIEAANKQTGAVPTTPPAVQVNPQRTSSSNSRRISQTFEAPAADDEDPEIQDISTIEPILEDEQQEFQKVLQEYLKSEQHKHGNTDQLSGLATEDPSMALFTQLLGGGPGAASQLNGSQQQQQQQNPLNPEEVEYNQKLIEYKKQQNDKFKAYFILSKLVTFVSLTLYYFTTQNLHSSFHQAVRFQYNNGDGSFFKVMMALEAVFTSVYAAKIHGLEDNEYTFSFAKVLGYLQYVPESFLSQRWRGRIRLVVKYVDLLQLILFDLSVVVVVFGLLSFMY